MSQILKPSNLSLVWASAGDVLNPGNTKYATGWGVEIPPRQWFNYLDNRQDTAIAHINQHGIAVWDANTEYQEDKSYVQGPSNGTIYRSVQTNINQNPETDVTNTYWIVAFAGAGDFYTKAEADGAFLAKSANGSDILNAATFRNNISVYSQAQTYTKAEVDAKTTVASTAQAQAQASNAVMITPLRLAEAFQGANQLRSAATTRQDLPGGFKIQSGVVTVTAEGGVTPSVDVTFGSAYTTVVFVYAQFHYSGVRTDNSNVAQIRNKTNTGFTADNQWTGGGVSIGGTIEWFAWGY